MYIGTKKLQPKYENCWSFIINYTTKKKLQVYQTNVLVLIYGLFSSYCES